MNAGGVLLTGGVRMFWEDQAAAEPLRLGLRCALLQASLWPVLTVFCQLCGQPVSRRGFDAHCAVCGEIDAGIAAASVIRQTQFTGFFPNIA